MAKQTRLVFLLLLSVVERWTRYRLARQIMEIGRANLEQALTLKHVRQMVNSVVGACLIVGTI